MSFTLRAFGARLTSRGTQTGTDQRVARFLKRGIELTGLAVLDPIDLATAHALAASSVPISPVASNQGSTIASTSAATPSSSSSNGGNGNNHGGGFFGRFKRFGANSTTSTSSNPAAKVLSSLTAGSSSSSSAEGPSAYALPLLRTRSSHTASPIIHPSRTSLSTPFDPSQPSTATSSDRGYSFQVRKWIRSEFADASPPKSGFRLEWVRAVRRSPSSRRGGGGRAATTAGASRASSLSGRSVEVQAADRVTATGLSRPASDPSSPAVVDEPSSSGGPSHNNDADDRDRTDADADDDDDEEERAWICTLVYPLSGGFAQQHGYGAGRQSTESTRPPPPPSSSASHPTSPTSPPSSSSHLPTTRRMHLATLQPAPHHPKLVSTLLLPPTLPSIPIGSYSPQRGLLGGVLGPEDLRDLAMVTAMWVAVREGLGALEGVVEQMVGSSNTTTTATATTTEGVSGTSPPSSYPAVPTAEPRTSMSSTNARVTTTTTTTLAEAASPPSAKAPPVVVVASSSPRKSAAPAPHNNSNNKGSISSNRRKGATGIVSGLFGGGGGGGGGGARGSSSSSTLGLRERFAAATAR